MKPNSPGIKSKGKASKGPQKPQGSPHLSKSKGVSPPPEPQDILKQYEFIVNTSKDFLSLISRDYRYVTLNTAYCNALQKPLQDIVGRTVAEVWGEELFERTIKSHLDKCFEGRESTYKGTFKFTKPGRESYIEVTYYPYLDSSGEVTHAVVVSRDITEKKAAEDQLLSLKKAVETMQLGVTITDLQGTIVYSNPAEAQMHGYEADELIGKNVGIFTTLKKLKPKTIEELEGMGTWRREAVNLRKDGATFPVQLFSDVVRNADGRPTGIVTSSEDITERKQIEEKIKKAYRVTRDILKKSPFGIFLVGPNGTVEYVNVAMQGLSEASSNTGDNVFDMQLYVKEGIDRKIAGVLQGKPFSTDAIEFLTNGGEKRTIRKFFGIPFEEDNIKKALIFVEDLTDLKEAEQAIEQSRQDWENTFNSITDIITVQDNDFNIIEANTTARKVLGLPAVGNLPAKCFAHYHGKDKPPKWCQSCESRLTGKPTVSEFFEPHLNVHLEVNAIPRFDSSGRQTGIIHVARDITERKKLEDELKQRALYDSLTMLPNRILFMDRLKNLFARKEREKDFLFAILFVDLDDFKRINDSLGHEAGDNLLVAFVQRLIKCTRPGDTVSRFGGDEFVIILDEISSEKDAITVSTRIHEDLTVPFSLEGQEIFMTTAIGIAVLDQTYNQPEEFLRNADTAMSHAKGKGRGNSVMFKHSMHENMLESMQLGNDLQRAVLREEFILYYQPIVDLKTHTVEGFEALIRWQHPEKGIVGPNKFIPILEQSNMIVEVGDWVIREACRMVKNLIEEFPKDPPLYVNVNISTKQFTHELPLKLTQSAAEFHLDPQCLRLEITESIIMANAETASATLTTLRDMDIKVYLDDFGTGYSSLNYLHKFPVSALKIDRSFVKNVLYDRGADEIVRAILSLSRNLQMKVVIEGVETPEQLEHFRALNCYCIQGFIFSKPLDGKDVLKYLQQFNG